MKIEVYESLTKCSVFDEKVNLEQIFSALNLNPKINCFVYLNSKGELTRLTTEEDFQSFVLFSKFTNKPSAILLCQYIENFENYSRFTHTFISILEVSIGSQRLKKHKTYSVQWKIKNLGKAVWDPKEVFCDDSRVVIQSALLPELLVEMVGNAVICFKFVDDDPNDCQGVRIKFGLSNQNEKNFYQSLEINADFYIDQQFSVLKSMGFPDDDNIFQALEDCEDDFDRTLQKLLSIVNY